MAKKALLMILDGWGCGDHQKDDVIFNTPTPYWDSLLATYPHSQLQASGENVGLPDGQMGNSEVGHLNIGAGRIVYQDLVKINRACADGSILKNVYTLHWNICSNCVTLPRNMVWKIHSSTVLWTVVIPTRRVVKDLSNNWKHTVLSRQVRLLLS